MNTLCPNGHRVEVSAGQIGLETRCPTCQQVFTVTSTTHPSNATDPVVAPRTAGDHWADRYNFDFLEKLRPFTQLLLLFGLILALFARGWDAVGDRNAASAKANVQAAVNDWNDYWEDRIDKVDAEEKSLREDPELSADERERLTELRTQRQQLLDERAADRAKEVDRWNDLEREARETETGNLLAKPWREGLFVLATILLAVGLLSLGVTTEGPVRWFCLVLLAIILLSLYHGTFSLVSTIFGGSGTA